ncbi:hypothetical protein [Pseudomonas sp. NA-150]|uniref:hypothetical protein n=1 Tax=Pseudomonas sp. NA-150 TaxID=3367525 RepID=UPI0037C7B0A9
MKVAVIIFASFLVLAGCSGSSARQKICRLMVPASVETPSSQDDQRVDEKVTGSTLDDTNREQNCP